MTQSLHEFLEKHGEEAILVRVAEARGSTPRETGTLMAVTRDAISGTIGGGRLEWEAMETARTMLAQGVGRLDQHILDQPLGPALGQCCGGRVKLVLRRARQKDASVARSRHRETWQASPGVLVFGAGHVGLALARALAPLPLRVKLVDERASALRHVPEGIDWELTALPESVLADATPGTCFVVMTHDHGLDFALASAALAREDAAYVGMIGSLTKRAKFERYAVREAGLDGDMAERLICPMAPHARRDKRPEVIAAFVAAEVLGAALRSRGVRGVSDRALARHVPDMARV